MNFMTASNKNHVDCLEKEYLLMSVRGIEACKEITTLKSILILALVTNHFFFDHAVTYSLRTAPSLNPNTIPWYLMT
jgi:hypothetical protein